MIKIYKIKQTSSSMLFWVGDKPRRVEFNGGSRMNGGHGQFATEDEALQKAIESHHDFGSIQTSQIYLDYTSEPEQVIEKVVEEVEEIIPSKIDFATAKQLLIEKGISPDELKNFPQVKKQAKLHGIEL